MPSLGGDIPLETCLSEMTAAGFIGTEMGTKYPRDPKELVPLLNSKGLMLASGWYSGNLMKHSVEQEIESVQNHLSLLKAAGSEVMVVGEVSNSVHGDIGVPISRRTVLTSRQWREYGEKITCFSDYLLEHGVQMAYHHHVGTIVETTSDLEMLFEVTGPSVGITLDTAHITYAGGNPEDILRRFPERIAHIHTKDVREEVLVQARNEDWPFLKAVLAGVFTVPGDGSINFTAVLQALKDIDYQGWIIVEAEQDPKVYNPITYALMAYKNMTQYVSDLSL